MAGPDNAKAGPTAEVTTGLDEEERRSLAYRRTGEFIYFWLRRFYAKFYIQVMPGLTGNQLFVLTLIGRHGRLTVSELAGDWGVSPSAITGVTDRLARQGLVVRRRDEGDRRLVYLELTEEGRKTVSAFLQQRQNMIARHFDRMSLSEVERMVATMEQMMVIAQDKEF
jgi:DNA-binding MarR family transcriptional regulator